MALSQEEIRSAERLDLAEVPAISPIRPIEACKGNMNHIDDGHCSSVSCHFA